MMTEFDNFSDEPIPLIKIGADEKLIINEKALNDLRGIQGKICVLAMAGLYRTGKSSMLNWLMDKQQGFRVGPTVERCTRGIWLWGKPKQMTLPSGESVSVLTLDTEGLGGLQASAKYDCRIFSLATLLCSTLIYNSLGSIDEKAINGLSFIANLTKHIRVRAESDEDNIKELDEFSPSFMWIVRDFSLELVDEDGDEITSTEYLDRALATKPGADKSTMERNRVRKILTAFFKTRDCFTIVRPLNDEAKLQQIDQVPISELRPEFQSQLEALKNTIFKSVVPKTMNGVALNGSMYAGLLQAYVTAMNTGGVPTIHSAWEDVMTQECKQALRDTLATFEKSVKEKISQVESSPMESVELQEFVTSNKENAVNAFESRTTNTNDNRHYKDELLEKLKSISLELQNRNYKSSEKFCNNVITSEFEKSIEPKLAEDLGGFVDIKDFNDNWKIFKNTYEGVARGPASLQCWNAFADAKVMECTRVIFARTSDAYENKLRRVNQEAAQSKEELATISSREEVFKSQVNDMQQEVATVSSERTRLLAETSSQVETIDELKQKLLEATTALSKERDHNEITLKEVQGKLSAVDVIAAEKEKLEKQLKLVAQAKERQELEIGMLTDENESLRKGSTCACVIS